MTQTQESFETIKKRYVKANASYKQVILKKYGVKDINMLQETLKPVIKELKGTKMQLSIALLNNSAKTVKVSFQKQVKLEDVYKEVMESYLNSTPLTFSKAITKSLKKALNGVERIATGFHNSKLDGHGRLYFVDTDQILDKSKSYDNRIIMLSLNQLNWIEIGQTKYTLK